MEANNMKAMREALENSNGLLEELAVIGEWGESAREQIAENNAALSAPPRNCDVGTAAEQSRRFCAFCRPRTEPCDGCSCLEDAQHGRCEFIWAQMPCEEGGTK